MKADELRRRAAEHARRLEEEGCVLQPALPVGKNMAARFWGKAWMKYLAKSETYGMRLAPGRTLLRNGCVIDLLIEEGQAYARVAEGDLLCEVQVRIRPLDDEEKEVLRERCSGRINSWVDLLEGRVGEDLMELLCDPEQGILPGVSDWRMSCPCDDYAEPCCHAAAVLYAVGVRLDEAPELLFTLRGVAAEDILPNTAELNDGHGALDGQNLCSLFGIDLQEGAY